MPRNERGEYVNEKGITIKISEHNDGSGAKIDFYDKNPSEKGHKSIHIDVNADNKTYTSTDNVSGSKKSSSGECYLKSACINRFQESFDDNCYELRVLKWFRDNFVAKEDIEHYYKTAPLIVESINKNDGSNILYGYIYEKVISACVKAIEVGDYSFAYNRYKHSILSFEETFARPQLEKRLVKALKGNS